MIDKIQLEKEINVIKKYLNDVEIISDHLNAIFPFSYVTVDLGGHLLDAYIDLLEKKYEDDSISYYVWECSLGDKPKKMFIDEEEILVDSIDSLVYCMEKLKEK